MQNTSISGGLTSDLIDITPLLILGWDGESVSWITRCRWYVYQLANRLEHWCIAPQRTRQSRKSCRRCRTDRWLNGSHLYR